MKTRLFTKLMHGATVVCFLVAGCLMLTAGCQENGKACPQTCKQTKSCGDKEAPDKTAKKGCTKPCAKPCSKHAPAKDKAATDVK